MKDLEQNVFPNHVYADAVLDVDVQLSADEVDDVGRGKDKNA